MVIIMINREATIRWKGYDPNDLKLHSGKKVWVNCDNCGNGRWVIKNNCHDLCHNCSVHTDIHRDNQRKNTIDQFENPLNRERAKERTIKQFKDPEMYNIACEAQKNRWLDPREHERARDKAIEQWKDPEMREMQSARLQGIPYDEWTGFSNNDWRDWTNIIYINNWFEGCHRHHITETVVICIPAELHHHIGHHLKTGRNMGEMNILALQYVFTDILCSIYNGCDINV